MLKFKKIAIILVVLAMLVAFAACSNKDDGKSATTPENPVTTEDEDKEKNSETQEKELQTAVGVVKEISLTEMKITLEEGKEVVLNVEGVEGISDIALGDTIEVDYTKGEDESLNLGSFKVTKKAEASTEQTNSEIKPVEPVKQPSQTSQTQNPVTQENSVSEKKPAKEETKKDTSTEKDNKPSVPNKEPVEESLTYQEKAKKVVATGDFEISDWNAQATGICAAQSTLAFTDKSDSTIIAFINKEPDNAIYKKYYGHYPALIGYIKLLNDYRGLPTGVAIEGNSQYEYDKSTDTFIFTKDLSPDANPENKPEEKPQKPEEKPDKGDETSLDSLIDLVNDYRTQNGLDELSVDDDIMEFAAIRAEEIYTKYSHERPDGSRPSQLGYWEIITKTHSNEQSALNSWKNSADHNDILLEPSITKVGAGVYNGHWVMLFMD